MALYADLYGLIGSTALKNRLAIAVAVKAAALFDAANPTAEQLAWAAQAVANPHAKAEPFYLYLLAKNKGLTVAQINAVTDDAMQTAVDALVEKIIAGGSA
jgi:hypothetical protein